MRAHSGGVVAMPAYTRVLMQVTTICMTACVPTLVGRSQRRGHLWVHVAKGTPWRSPLTKAFTPCALSYHSQGPRPLMVAAKVILVLVLAASCKVGLLDGSTVACTAFQHSANAAGRALAMSAAKSLLEQYGLQPAQAPLMLAGIVPIGDDSDYVFAALGDDVHSAHVTLLAEVPEGPMRSYIALAIACVEQTATRHPKCDANGGRANDLLFRPTVAILGLLSVNWWLFWTHFG